MLKNLITEICASYLSLCYAFLSTFFLVWVVSCTEYNAALSGARNLHAHDKNCDV